VSLEDTLQEEGPNVDPITAVYMVSLQAYMLHFGIVTSLHI